MNYVIAGNGPAAVSCIEGIRTIDKSGEITLISGEVHDAYFRPLISYYLQGKSKARNIYCRDNEFYEKNDILTIYNEVVSLDAKEKIVTLAEGSETAYDKLCICTGSSPFVPPMNGLDTVEKKYTFLTIDDAYKIEKAISSDSKVLIIGAGLIGLKCAEGLRNRVGSVAVCDLAPRVLSSILDDECASFVQKHLENQGISFYLSDTADHFEKNKAIMKSGKKIDFDVLVLALGVRPNISFFKDAGGECGRAIKVANDMRTSLKDVFAAGDCVEQYDVSYDDQRIMALLPNANIGGFTAGVNMAGGDSSFDNAVPMNSIGFFGLHMMTSGSYPVDAELIEKKDEKSLKRFFIKDNKLKGFIMIGDVKSAGIFTDLVRNQKELSGIDLESLINDPTLIPFGEIYRRKKLGGVV